MTSFRHFLKDQSGTATIEFLFIFPIIFTIFTASFESSLYMAKFVMFDRGVDRVVREVRLGTFANLTHQQLKEQICMAGLLIRSKSDCMNRMKIWMQPVNTGTFDMVVPPKTCVDKVSDVNTGEPPANEFTYGTDNDIMLLRICMKEYPIFPTTAVSVKMPTDAVDGSVVMYVTSVFVNEPG